MKHALAVFGLLCLVGMVAAAQFQPVDLAPALPQPQSPPVRDVNVVNFPAVQTVEGTLTVEQPVAVEGAVAVSGEVTVGNLPAVQTVTGTVEVANLGGCQRPEPLVATLVDNYVIENAENFVSAPIDLTDYFGGQLALQLVTEGGENGAMNVYPQWMLADGQVVPSEGPAVNLQIDAYGTPAAGLRLGPVEGRILRVRVRSFTNVATVSVHIVASAD